MHTSLLPLLCRRLCAVAVWPLLMLSAVRADGEPFVARFETDATGTWLTYPTVPGWHYKVESSPTLEEDDFTFVPSTFSYGNGTVRRLFIAPPRPPADPNYQPPVRTFRLINVRLHVATDPGMEKSNSSAPATRPHGAWK